MGLFGRLIGRFLGKGQDAQGIGAVFDIDLTRLLEDVSGPDRAMFIKELARSTPTRTTSMNGAILYPENKASGE